MIKTIITPILLIVINIAVFSQSHYASGMSKIANGDYEGAEQDFTLMINQDYSKLGVSKDIWYSGAYGSRGFAKFLQGDYEGALEDYNTALKYDGYMQAAVYYRKLICEQKLGYPAEYDTIFDYIVRWYYKAIEKDFVLTASSFFIDSKQKKVQPILQYIADETEYIKIRDVKAETHLARYAVLKIKLIQKRHQKDYEEEWNIEMTLTKFYTDSFWQIESVQ